MGMSMGMDTLVFNKRGDTWVWRIKAMCGYIF